MLDHGNWREMVTFQLSVYAYLVIPAVHRGGTRRHRAEIHVCLSRHSRRLYSTELRTPKLRAAD